MTPGGRPAGARSWLGGLAWIQWALAMLGLVAVPWFDYLLRQAGRPDLVQLTPGAVPPILAVVSGATIGAVAVATLTVAALFRPAQHRIQAAADRRFNRGRYDAARTIQVFGDRLRQQIDLDTLAAELLAVVDQTIQPTQVSLWLRPSRGVSHGPEPEGARSDSGRSHGPA